MGDHFVVTFFERCVLQEEMQEVIDAMFEKKVCSNPRGTLYYNNYIVLFQSANKNMFIY